jgi:beta-ribofuranosylaminobenzene 5'-phosphate synthase
MLKPAPSSPRAVRVDAPARLHFGFLDLEGGLGRRFGSIGLAIDRPRTVVTLREAGEPAARGLEQARALAALERIAAALGLPPAAHVDTTEAIPPHAGLGSGTQLAVAIGVGLCALAGRRASVRELGEIVERGARSSIGLAAFEEGGFVVDGGRAPGPHPPPVVARMAFPEAWRILLIQDQRGHGLHGEDEAAAFRALPAFSAAAAGQLCRLMLMQVLPGLKERDIAAFGAGIAEIQAVIGDYFAPAQGGTRWTSPAVGRLAGRLAAGGAVGIGQTSWGPTGYAFAASQAEAERLAGSVAAQATAEGLALTIAKGRNTGARVDTAGGAPLTTELSEEMP